MKLKDSISNDSNKVIDRIGTRKYKSNKLNALSFFSGAMGLENAGAPLEKTIAADVIIKKNKL